MQPFERLRHLARWSGAGGSELLGEAAECLAGFAADPAGLVVACRRLLAYQPGEGALWWLCARVLCASDPNDAAWEAWADLSEDPTDARLTGALPFPHDGAIAVIGWPEITAGALSTRSDLDVVVVRRRAGDDRLGARLRRSERPARLVSEPELDALAPTHLLVETPATGADEALVPGGTAELAATVHAGGGAVWLVAGVGRVLPRRLFAALCARVTGDDSLEPVSVRSFDKVATRTGLEAPSALAGLADCPAAPELLRPG